MAVYSMGTILKKCREMKGITQEELCYGICTASALSKMEHGVREPSYVKFASLMERMGEWPEAYDVFIGDKVYRIHELQSKVRSKIYHEEYQAADTILDELEKEIANFPNETIYNQFLRMQREICKANGIIQREQIEALTNLLKWTVPCFGNKPIKQCFLSHQELTLINNIAIGYGESGELKKAVDLLKELQEYLERNYMGKRNRATMHSTVLFNLVKYLGLSGEYYEALELASRAIDILTETGKTLDVAILHYDIAWIFCRIDKKKYMQKIEDELLISLYADLSNRKYHSADITIQFIENDVKELMESVNLHHFLDVYHRMAPAHFQKQNPSE